MKRLVDTTTKEMVSYVQGEWDRTRGEVSFAVMCTRREASGFERALKREGYSFEKGEIGTGLMQRKSDVYSIRYHVRK